MTQESSKYGACAIVFSFTFQLNFLKAFWIITKIFHLIFNFRIDESECEENLWEAKICDLTNKPVPFVLGNFWRSEQLLAFGATFCSSSNFEQCLPLLSYFWEKQKFRTHIKLEKVNDFIKIVNLCEFLDNGYQPFWTQMNHAFCSVILKSILKSPTYLRATLFFFFFFLPLYHFIFMQIILPSPPANSKS